MSCGSLPREIVACYSGPGTIDEGNWRIALAERLPGYMVPASFLRLDSLPVTSTGKIDRLALRERALASTGPVDPA